MSLLGYRFKHWQTHPPNPSLYNSSHLHSGEGTEAWESGFESVEYSQWWWLLRIELIGQLLILGVFDNGEVHMCELIVTESDALIKSGYETVRIKSYGHFVALSQVVGQQDQQVHLFTAIYESRDCTDILEYKFNLSVDDSDFNQLSTQPIHALRVKGEFRPYYLVNVNSYSSVLIGKDYP